MVPNAFSAGLATTAGTSPANAIVHWPSLPTIREASLLDHPLLYPAAPSAGRKASTIVES
jgi:hypothetical protein